MSDLLNAYALLIGVGNDLPVTARDATAIYNILSDEKLAGYRPENVTLLTEKEATRTNILKAFDTLIERTDVNSSVFLFYSGHGGTYSDNDFLTEEHSKPEAENQQYFHLVPNDYDPDNYEETWVKAEELKEKIAALKSRRLVFFLDCCHAAGMTKSVVLNAAEVPVQSLERAEGLAQKIDDGQGISIVSSCREDQQSYIMEGDHNSLFTKTLIEVLKGRHKTVFDEPYIRMTEVTQYIFRKVPQENPDQQPYVNLQMYDDFILSYLPEDVIQQNALVQPVSPDSEVKASKKITTVFKETETAQNVIIFIHGFAGYASETFGEIPELLMEEAKLEGWDLFPLGYSEHVVPDLGKQVWASVEDMERVVDHLQTSLQYKFGGYKRIALLAHGLGGLVVQRALVSVKDSILKRISHVICFGTPSSGLPAETITKWNNASLSALTAGSSFITALRTQWNDRFAETYPFVFSAVAGTDDEYIPTHSSLKPFKEEHRNTVQGNHFGMIQVSEKNNDTYLLIINILTGNKFHNHFTSSEAINNALGDYELVVQELLPKVAELDKRALEQLLFALEGLDRDEEVSTLLNTHELIKNDSNFLGIIGGRLKRLYLQTSKVVDGENAYDYYKKGLAMAMEAMNTKQVYYHAINLAFLDLVLRGNEHEMTQHATQALEAATQDPFPSLWNLATKAEANLYLGAFEAAKVFYAKAAEMAGIREKLSIYTNAYHAYTTLLNTTSETDELIKSLKVNFLS